MSESGPDPIALNLARVVYRLITDPHGWRVDLLRDELNIAPRTYRKYRKLLTEFPAFRRADGTPMVEEIDDGAHRWLRLVTAPVAEIRQRKAFLGRIAAMYLAQQMFAFLRETEVANAFEVLFTDLRRRTRDGAWIYRDLLVNADRMFYLLPDAPKDYSERGHLISDVLHALLFKHRLRVLYYSASTGAEREQDLEPLTLLSWRSALYLIARRVGQKKPRTFAIDRIRAIEVLDETFAYPDRAEYTPGQVTEGAFGLFNESARRKNSVDLVFGNEPWLKAHLTERQWHRSQRFDELPDGRLRMRFKVSSLVEVWPWVRAFGPRVWILSPDPGDDPRAADLVSRKVSRIEDARDTAGS